MKIIMYDLQRGFIYVKWKIIFAVVMIFFLEVVAYRELKLILDSSSTGVFPGAWDIILHIMKGIKPYNPQNDKFVLPFFWMSIQFLTSIIVYDYIIEDMNGYGLQFMIRYNKKYKWWISKCIWGLTVTIAFYLFFYGSNILWEISFNRKLIGITPTYLEFITNLTYTKQQEKNIILFLTTVPFLASFTMVLLQMLISIVFSPVISIISIMAIHFLSIYFSIPIYSENYSLLLRSSIIYKKGFHPVNGIIIYLIEIVVLVIIGIRYFTILDIYEREKV